MKNKTYKVVKVFNNNIILVLEDSFKKVIFGKGIGFGKHPGEIIAHSSHIEKVFTLQDPSNQGKFSELVSKVDEEVLAACEEMISMIQKELNEPLHESIHISLTDHISFTVKRLKENSEIVNPFLIETEVLFKKEYDLASKAVNILENRIGMKIPAGEIGFIALHIHSARNKGNLSNTIKYTYLANIIAEFIENTFNMKLDRDSLDYARFVVHLRFAMERLLNNTPIKNELLTTIKRKYKNSYNISKQIAKIMENNLNIKVVPDEIGYIAIHLENLTKKMRVQSF